MKTNTLHVVAKPKPDPRFGLLNPAFVYTPAANTDIRALFERVRRELAKPGKAAS